MPDSTHVWWLRLEDERRRAHTRGTIRPYSRWLRYQKQRLTSAKRGSPLTDEQARALRSLPGWSEPKDWSSRLDRVRQAVIRSGDVDQADRGWFSYQQQRARGVRGAALSAQQSQALAEVVAMRDAHRRLRHRSAHVIEDQTQTIGDPIWFTNFVATWQFVRTVGMLPNTLWVRRQAERWTNGQLLQSERHALSQLDGWAEFLTTSSVETASSFSSRAASR